MARLDERTKLKMQFSSRELDEIDFRDKRAMEVCLGAAPLAVPNSKGVLNLDTGPINPAYRERLSEFREKVVKRVCAGSATELSQNQWLKIKAIFAPYREWLENKQGARVERVGEDRLRDYLGGSYRSKIEELIAKDLVVADNLNQIHNLEKLILYQRWLVELANNFVSFANFYNPRCRSLPEAGTLVIDGREMTFTMRVRDRAAHKKIAAESFIYLLYLEITGRRDKDIKFEIVAAVTAGDSGSLRIGKRGIFFTIDGRQWDALVVDIVENPISPWESVRAPFKQFTGFIKKRIDKFTQSRQAKLEKSFSAPNVPGMTRNLLLGGSIALAALGSALAYITKALSQVKPFHILLMLAALAIVILVPGMIVGFVKIHKRDMSVLLEASGWAVNVHMRLRALRKNFYTYSLFAQWCAQGAFRYCYTVRKRI